MKKAVILVSGGLDSATTLAWAKSEGYECYALSVNYNQRNHPEIAAAKKVTQTLGAKEHRFIDLDLSGWGGSALTDLSIDVPTQASDDVPVTYVPARNTILLSLALAWAEVLGAKTIMYGANHIDYSNYPDCRPDYIEAFVKMANLATRAGAEGDEIEILTPLLELNKAEIIQLGTKLGVDYAMTITCYDPDASGAACGVCDSCRFRAKGFQEAGVEDPTLYQV